MMTFPIAFATLLLLAVWLMFFSSCPGVAVVGGASRVALVAMSPSSSQRFASEASPATSCLFSNSGGRRVRRRPCNLEPPAAGGRCARGGAFGRAQRSMRQRPRPRRHRFRLPSRHPQPRRRPPTYPQFLGTNRNGTVNGLRLADDWAKRPPRLVWRRPIGAGWSGFAVARGLAVTQEQRGNREMVVAYSLSDGTPKWSHGDEANFESTIAGDGPRATPTISHGRVFTLGSTGLLNCLDLETGRAIWRRDIAADNSSPQPDFGRSSSPLVVDELIVISAGGSAGRSLVAYRRDTGEPAWHAGDDIASYSSPVLATLAGVRQIVVLNQSSVAGHDPATGRVLWTHDWPRTAPTVAVPLVVSENRVLLSAGYGVGSRLLQISRDGDAVNQTLVWESTRLKAKFTNPVLHDGFVYGLDDGVLVCLDLATGERRWKSGRYGHGQTLLVGNRLIVQTEDGELVLVEASPAAHREIARFTVFQQKTWNPPALAGRYLLVRTDTEAVCYELAGE